MTPRPSGAGRPGARLFALAAALSLVPLAAPAAAAPLERAAAVARALAHAPEAAAFGAALADSARLASAAGAYPSAPRLELAAEFDEFRPFDAVASELRLGLSQELDTSDRRGARRAVAAAEATVTRAAARAQALALAGRTDEAFGALLVAGRRVALADSAAASAARLAAAGQRAARAEAITAYDQRRLELDFARARDRAVVARGARADAAAALRVLMLAPADEAIEPIDDSADAPWRCAADRLAELALAGRPDLALARAEEARLAAESALAAREGRPGPEVGVFVARVRDRLGPFDETGTTVGAQVALPLNFLAPARWNAGRIDVAGGSARAARLRLEAAVPIEVAAACAQVDAAQERVALLGEALAHADSDRARIESAYREGRLDLEAALAQRERLFAAGEAEADARAALEASRAALVHATGMSHAELAAALGGPPHGDSR